MHIGIAIIGAMRTTKVRAFSIIENTPGAISNHTKSIVRGFLP